ncbi:MAG: ABC transporter permease [Reyranellaceae bacterium]
MLNEVTVRSLPTTVATGLLVGFALVSPGGLLAGPDRRPGLVGPVIVVLLVREFVPILVGLILFGRTGTATLIEARRSAPRGWLRLLEEPGPRPADAADRAARLRLRGRRVLPRPPCCWCRPWRPAT